MKGLFSAIVVAGLMMASPVTVSASEQADGCAYIAFVARDVMFRRQEGDSFHDVNSTMQHPLYQAMVADAFTINHVRGSHMQVVRDALIQDFRDAYYVACLENRISYE